MKQKAVQLFKDIQRELLLARTNDRKESYGHLYEASKNVTELKAIWDKEE